MVYSSTIIDEQHLEIVLDLYYHGYDDITQLIKDEIRDYKSKNL